MARSIKITAVRCNTDIAGQYVDEMTARFIKNMTANVSATNASGDITEGQNQIIQKSLLSNELYVANIDLPEGDNFCIGAKGFAQVNRVYCFCWNSNNNHFIYRVNGNDRTFEMVKITSLFNFQLNPIYFVHNQGVWLDVINIVDPDTGNVELIEDLYWTEGFNYMGYIRVNDCIATDGFNPDKFIYFIGDYDPAIFFRMGLPTPNSCIQVVEIPRTPEDAGLINNLLFNTWQFRISVTDVFDRPSEHSIISDIYLPGINDCIGSNQALPRCLNLIFNADNPLWNTIDIEYRNCNDTQWYKTETLFLYLESDKDDWWTRQRNPSVNFNPITSNITYNFCANGERNAVPTTETVRLENPLPKRCQSLTKISDRIAPANNIDGFNPLPQTLLNQISLQVIPPEQIPIISRTITLFIPIYSIGANITGGVNNNQSGNYFAGVVKDGTSGFIWGSGSNGKGDGVRAYSQFFPDEKQSGFPVYLLDSQSVAISTQVYIDGSGNIIDDPNHNGVGLGFLCFQKIVFTDLRPDTYVVRLASHLSDPNTLGGQTLPSDAGTFLSLFDTSTTVWGVCPFTKGSFNIDVFNRNSNQELVINVCDGDYDTFGIVGTNPSNQILVIADVSFSLGASSGYGYESRLNGDSPYPMELMQIIPSANTTTPKNTDHNGFYWSLFDFGSRSINLYSFDFYFYNNCIKQHVTSVFLTNFGMGFFNFYMDEIGSQIVNTGAPAYPNFLHTLCNRIQVKGRIVLTSNNNVGIPNVLVVLTRGQIGFTDDNGEYTIIAHDDVTNGVRNDVVVFSGSVCNYKNVDGGCIPTQPVQILPCIFGTCTERDVLVNDIDVIYTTIKSLLSGGTYGVGLIAWDWLGRGTFIQDLGKIKIPTIIQSQTIGASQVQVTISSDATFPKEFQYLTFLYTNELTYSDYIDWIVDRFDLIDNTGEINNLAPTQIRIYYASLNQFNAENNFNTTTDWDFLEPLPTGQTTGTQQPFTSDVVQFLFNGSQGFYFGALPEPTGFVPKLITALVKYDQTGQYFLIDYTSELAGLNPQGSNALIRLARPRTVINEFESYFETCNVVELINQKAQENQFILNAFDTYYLDRQIPIPAAPAPTGTTAVQSITTTDGSVATTVVPITQPIALSLQVFPFPFESNSPSNFWGQGCKNIGRVNTKNPYESEDINYNQIALSGVAGEINFLQYFDEALKTDIPIQDTSGIVSIIYRQGKVIGITQYSKFSVGYNDNEVRVNKAGQVIAPSADDQFGNPKVDLQNDFGCQLIDKNSIIDINGYVMFVDRNRGQAVRYDFSRIESFTKDDRLNEYGVKQGRCDAWFRTKIKAMKNDPTRYFVGGYDPICFEYLITDFSLTTKNYINQERTYNSKSNETVVFDINTLELRGWRSFLTEMSAYLDGDILSNQLFSFKGANAYSHYNVNENKSFNEFFGVQCERVIEIISAQPIFKKKKFNTISVYSKQSKFFSDKITTQSGQLSYLFLSDFQQALYFTFAPFMQDVKSLPDPNQPAVINNNPLQEGNPLYGEFISVRLIGDPAQNNVYTELLGVIIEAYDYEHTGEIPKPRRGQG